MPLYLKHKLKDLCTKIGSGSTPRGGDSVYKTHGISLIRSQNILDFTFSKNGLAYIDEVQAKELANVTLKERDVLLNITGDSVARVSQVPDNILPARVNQHVAIIRANQEKLTPEYLKYCLLSKPNKELLLSLASTGATRKAITKVMIEEFEIAIPDEEGTNTQTRIAAILSALDDKIELNRRTNETLEKIAETLFKKYFVEGIDEENLPEGWRMGKLGEIIEIFDSKRIPLSSLERETRKGIYPYYGAASLMDYIDSYIFDGVYLLLGEDGSVIDKNGFPILQYVWGKFWVNNHAHVIKGKQHYSTDYLYILLKNTVVNHLVTGAVQLKINQSNLNNLEIIIPDKITCDKFSSEIDSLFSLKRNNIDENNNLENLRVSLLPKLMSGEIEVN